MILALDTSTSCLSLALGAVENGQLRWLASRMHRGTGKHTAGLPLAIEELLTDAQIAPEQLIGCAVGLGPGNFTGLRVGLSTIKGLAYGRQLPVAGVSSLRALAFQAMKGLSRTSPVVALLDARHGQIYAGIFTGAEARPQGAEFSLAPAVLAAALGDLRSQVLLVGEGMVAYRSILERDFEAAQCAEEPLTPDARAIGELCLPLPPFSLKGLFALEPSYVLPSEAEIKFPNGNFRPRQL